MNISKKYRKKLDNYLLWRIDNFLRPEEVEFSATGPSSDEAMFSWETYGVIPQNCSNPSLLADYIQGKKSRDWHIKEWRLAIREGYFYPSEFVGQFGMTELEVNKSLI